MFRRAFGLYAVDALRYVADRWRGIDPLSHRSLYFKHQPLHDVTGIEVRWFVACASLDAAQALLTRATAVTMVRFRDALVECVTDGARTLGIADEVAHLWKVAEVVQIAPPLLFDRHRRCHIGRHSRLLRRKHRRRRVEEEQEAHNEANDGAERR